MGDGCEGFVWVLGDIVKMVKKLCGIFVLFVYYCLVLL